MSNRGRRTQVFAYKGYIGIEANTKVEGLLNDPYGKDQLGYIVDADYVEIQPEALELLKEIKRSEDDIGVVDVYKNDNGKVIFSWMGVNYRAFRPCRVTGGSAYDPTLLKSDSTVMPPYEFKVFVDNLISKVM